MQQTRFKNFKEFYPFYLGEHQNVICRRLHFFGSCLALLNLFNLFLTGKFTFLFYALLCGYSFAWIGHLFFEKNRPATFKYPVYSFIGDWVMFKDILNGKVKIF
jgi:hypothetical protein